MKAGRKAKPPARNRSQHGGRRSGAPTRRPRQGALRRRPQAGPQTAPMPGLAERPARPATTSQAKARSKARKAKAPKVVRPPLPERLINRLAQRLVAVDLRPRALLARVPFVVLIIGTLGMGLAITLWLSTDSAQRSYQLGSARALNDALVQQKEALERDVLEGQSAPALAEAARELGMIPSRGTAHLVQDPAGNWVVVGQPKPAEGVPPPPLNTELPDERPPAPAGPAAGAPKPGAEVEVPRRVTPGSGTAAANPEVAVRLPAALPQASPHAPNGATLPGPPPLPGPAGSAPVVAAR